MVLHAATVSVDVAESVTNSCSPYVLSHVEDEYDAFYPIAFKVSNSYQIKDLLDFGRIFPCGATFSAYAKILYADKVKSAVEALEFSQAA